MKIIFFVIFWPGKSLTPHHYWGFTTPCALSSVGKTEKKKKKNFLLTSSLGNHSMAKCNTSCSCVSLFRMKRLVRIVLSLHSINHTQPAVIPPANARERHKDRWEKTDTDSFQAWRAVKPATSAYNSQRTETHLNTQPLQNNTEPYKTSIAGGSNHLPYDPWNILVAKTASWKYCSIRSQVYPPYSKYIMLLHGSGKNR